MARRPRPLAAALALATVLLACGNDGGDRDGGDDLFLPDPPASVPPVSHPELARVDDFC